MSRSQNNLIRIFPDPILRYVPEPVKRFDENLRSSIDKLDKIMRLQRHGIGIAAPQIGLSMRFAIIDLSSRIATSRRIILVNPHILAAWDEIGSREGCMSIPDYMANIKRYKRIKLRWEDESGICMTKSFEGIEAICIQHEVDHLNGKLFIDRVANLKRDMIPRRT